MNNIISLLIIISFIMIITVPSIDARESSSTQLENDPNRGTSEHIAFVRFYSVIVLDSDIFYKPMDGKVPDSIKQKNYDLLYMLEEGEKLIMVLPYTSGTNSLWEVWELREGATRQFIPIIGDRILIDGNAIDWRSCDWRDLQDCHQVVP